METAETQTLLLTSEQGNNHDIAAQLARLTRDSGLEDRVELAWQIFRSAKTDNRNLLDHIRPTLPPETAPIIAATIKRLDGGNPIDEFERYRATSFAHKAELAAEALGRYLADPALSSPERSLENLTYAIKHRDDRVRRACLCEIGRLKPPGATEHLLKILLAHYPRNSVILKKNRQRWSRTAKVTFACITMGGYFIFLPKAFWVMFAINATYLFGSSLMTAIIDTLALDGDLHLSRTDRGEILQCIAESSDRESAALRQALPELRAMSTGAFYEPRAIKLTAAEIVRQLEGEESALPIPASPSRDSNGLLPVSARMDRNEGGD